jgi:hypothetical protein
MTKKLVREQVSAYPEMEGTALEIIAEMRKLIDQFGTTVSIKNEPRCYEEGYENNVYIQRTETDAEYQNRLKREQTDAEWYKARDIETLKRLKAKYGDV